MRFAVCLPLLCLITVAFAAPAQTHAQVTFEVEEIRRLTGQIEDLRAALEVQQRRIQSLEREVETLRGSVNRANDQVDTKLADYVTRDMLKNVVSAVEEVDRKRIKDRDVIVDEVKQQVQKLAATIKTIPPEEPKPATGGGVVFTGTVYPHKVESGQYLSTIVDAYNERFKREGKGKITIADVKKANPTININRIYVGQEILIPDPASVK